MEKLKEFEQKLEAFCKEFKEFKKKKRSQKLEKPWRLLEYSG